MKKYLLFLAIIISSFIIYSLTPHCTDNNNINSVTKSLVKNLKSQKLKKVGKYYEYKLDIDFRERKELKRIMNFFKDVNPKLIKTEIDMDNTNIYKMFYKSDAKYYLIRFIYFRKYERIFIESIRLFNINEECEIEANTPYCPDSKILISNFTYRLINERTLGQCYLDIENNTNQDIDYVKFRIEIYHWETEPDQLVNKKIASSTIEKLQRIFNGDKVRIYFDDFSNYSFSFDFNKDVSMGGVSLNMELIEVLPNPNLYWCKELEELQNNFR